MWLFLQLIGQEEITQESISCAMSIQFVGLFWPIPQLYFCCVTASALSFNAQQETYGDLQSYIIIYSNRLLMESQDTYIHALADIPDRIFTWL